MLILLTQYNFEKADTAISPTLLLPEATNDAVVIDIVDGIYKCTAQLTSKLYQVKKSMYRKLYRNTWVSIILTAGADWW